MNDSDKPSRSYREWLRQNAWPFHKHRREGADNVMPHLQEFLEQSKLLRKSTEDKEKEKGKKTDVDKPRH
jgi:hypothetical protein